MALSAPIHHLKRRAKILARTARIPLNQALDRIAREEGFSHWSLLVTRASAVPLARQLLSQLTPGDLLLLGARPGQGKTRLSLELIVEAIKSGRRGVFFTLEYNDIDVLNQFQALARSAAIFADQFEFDNSDAISANYITDRLKSAPKGTVVVIDYLQLLDQKRTNPELMIQVRALNAFAKDRGLIMVFLSQVDRSYELSARPCPNLSDVRLPNPLDLKLFNKTCFLNNGEVQIGMG